MKIASVSDVQETIEHHAAMDVTALVSGVVQIERLAKDVPHLIERDYEILTQAHAQLGRTLSRFVQKEAAQ